MLYSIFHEFHMSENQLEKIELCHMVIGPFIKKKSRIIFLWIRSLGVGFLSQF